MGCKTTDGDRLEGKKQLHPFQLVGKDREMPLKVEIYTIAIDKRVELYPKAQYVQMSMPVKKKGRVGAKETVPYQSICGPLITRANVFVCSSQ